MDQNIVTKDEGKSDTAWTKSQSKIEGKKLTDDWKRRKDKNRNEECRQTANRGSRDWSGMRSPVTLVTSDIRIHRDLTSQTLNGCSPHRHNKYLSDDENASEEDQVQTTNRISQQFRLWRQIFKIIIVAVTQHLTATDSSIRMVYFECSKYKNNH